MMYCIINGRMVPAAEAAVSVQDRGFRYGDGVFEAIAVQGGVPYQFNWHMDRLAGGLRAIKIPFMVDGLREHCRQLLMKNKLTDGILRIQVTRGIGGRGYLPDDAVEPTFVIETTKMPPVPQEPVSLWQSSYSKPSARVLPVRYKLCQGLHSTLARLEAAENECFDALLLNEQGQLCETSSANLFWFKGGTLYTPSLTCGILEGATRAAVLRLALYPLREVEEGIEELMQAEAVFITNTVWKAVAVERLLPLAVRWDSEGIADEVGSLLERDREDYCKMHRKDWQ